MKFRILTLLATILTLTSCGSEHDSAPKIVDGVSVPPNVSNPTVSFMVKTNQFGQVRTCSGVRLGEKTLLTTYSCGEDLNRWGKRILFMSSSNGEQVSDLTVKSVSKHRFTFAEFTNHDRYTKGLSKLVLYEFPSQLEAHTPIASLSFDSLAYGDSLRSYGGGCDIAKESGECLGMPILQAGGSLVYLDFKVKEDFSANEAIVYGDSRGFTSDGDQGGGVFNQHNQLVGLNIMVRDDFAPTFDTLPAYLFLGADEIRAFIEDSSTEAPSPPDDPIYLSIYREASLAKKQLEDCHFGTDFKILDKLGLVSPGGVGMLAFSYSLDSEPSQPDCIAPPGGREEWYRLQVARLMLLDVAYEHLKSGDKIAAQEALDLSIDIGLAILDMGVGAIPLVGNAKSAAECITGYGVIPPQELTEDEHIMACVGVVFGQAKVWKAIFSGFAELGSTFSYAVKIFNGGVDDIGEVVIKGAQKMVGSTPFTADEAAEVLGKIGGLVGPSKSASDILIKTHQWFKLASSDEVDLFIEGAKNGRLLPLSIVTESFHKSQLDTILYNGILDTNSHVRVQTGGFDRYEFIVKTESKTVGFVFKKSGGVKFLSAFEE